MVDPCHQLKTFDEFTAFFPRTATELRERVDIAMAQAHDIIRAIEKISDESRTFENTVTAFDQLVAQSYLASLQRVVYLLELVHPDADLRNAAHEALSKINGFMVDHVSGNVKLYSALKSYAHGATQGEDLDDEQRYFLQETLCDFERSGLNLSEDKRAEVGRLKKDLADLSSLYDCNIAQDNCKITVERKGLAGLSDEFIDMLDRDGERYQLGVDYPTYHAVMQECIVEDTRKKLFIGFNSRAYPVNDKVLRDMIKKRDKLATVLGFSSFAAYDIANQMAKTPGRVEPFVQKLLEQAGTKEDEELALLRNDLPESVSLTAEGKIKPWDMLFVQAQYRKKHLAIDEQQIAEYFPIDKTLPEIFTVYGQFLGVTFQEISCSGMWHDEVRSFAMQSGDDGAVIGYILLDLFPRPNKYTHAGHLGLFGGVIGANSCSPGISAIVANFSRAQGNRPALLKRNEVLTLFHELGHAMHSLFSRSRIASCAGIDAVKRDFVEVPSQLFEQWFWDADVLKRISSHFKTGQPLPDDLIGRIAEAKKFGAGYQVCRQGCFSLYSLGLFSGVQDPDALLKQLRIRYRQHEEPCADDHMYTAFTHLSGYGAKYYSYFWSEVIALDLFDQIKREGYLNPAVGKRLVSTLLGRGSSADPSAFVRAFLGRDANQDAFLAAKGLV